MGKSAYKRVTDNPKLSWSEERKAEASAQRKKMLADGTWFKMSKKQRGKNISKGLRDAAKRRNRSNGQLKRHANKEADFFSSTEINKRLDERKGKEQKALMSHPPTTLSENLLDKAVLPEEVLNGVAEVASDIEKEAPKSLVFPEPFETWTKAQVKEFAAKLDAVTGILDQAENAFGVRPTLHWILMTAIDEKMENVFSLLGFKKEEDE